MVTAILLFVKGWGLTLLGPVGLAVRAWLPGAGAWHAVKLAAGVATFGFAVYCGVQLGNWWQGDRLTVAEAQHQCSTTVAALTIAAQLKAVNARVRQVQEREAQVAADEEEIALERQKMKESRDASKSADSPRLFVGPDDPWLRHWQRPAAVGGAGRR